jgi:hypothetical protein
MIVCPFCGLAAALPHETQAACIDALQQEISRVREIVVRIRAQSVPPVSGITPISSGNPGAPN